MKRIARRRLTMLLACVFGGAPAGAHPVDEVVQGAYLTLIPGKVQLELDVTPGQAVSSTVIKALDANSDGRISTSEARSYATRVLNQSTLTLGGTPVRWTLDRVEVPVVPHLKVGGGILKIYAFAPRADRAGVQTLTYQNRYQPAKSQWTANVFLQPGGGWAYQVTGQTRSNDGRQLTVTYKVTR
ncbi:hypothetical protein [Deinococcus enclensis]|uniref:EF-hand domain-containing protein n=1 Tax=Deinococcus enclensis TaxID=1049582 RepID=A0ABT9MHR1_9DEIO|nr:hypothetical protein [Deinococcus enclensis]MDP9766129.1 hypothetical protein [Deinococcus enclensis]